MSATTETQVPSPGANAIGRRLFVVDGGRPAPCRTGISVLYVEDDEDDVFLVGRQLSALNSFDVATSCAPTIAAARAAIAERRYDVILCDFWLANETTVPFIAELRVAAGATPIVLVSSLDNDDIELIGRRAGADGFIAKADMNSASLERVFATLLRPGPKATATSGGAAVWLKALMSSLDRAQHASERLSVAADAQAAEYGVIEAIVGQSDEIRADLIEKLSSFERAIEAKPHVCRFDVVPHIGRGVERQRQRGSVPAVVRFTPPELPLTLDADPALFGDILDGFLAEAGDAVAAGQSVAVGLAVEAGNLTLTLSRLDGTRDRDGDGIVEAAAAERRRLVETLARSAGGGVVFAATDAGIGRLSLPLRR